MQSTAYRPTAGSSSREKWYYIDGGKKCGPVDKATLINMLSSGSLPQNTRVWASGMDKWISAADAQLMAQDDGSASVVEHQDTEKPAQPKRKSRWWIWLIVALAVVAAAAAACFFLFAPKEEVSDVQVIEEVVYGLKDPVVFENEECAFIVDAIGEKGDYLELDVRCVNKTGDKLYFAVDSTCINGRMFDPLWYVYVQGDSTMRSSITFPLSTLKSYNLLPADQIKFVLQVHNETQFNALLLESSKYIFRRADLSSSVARKYQRIDGYDAYVFAQSVKVDDDDRPYYEREIEETKENGEKNKTKIKIYFDEIYDRNGQRQYPSNDDVADFMDFYHDSFGRPYYFSEMADTVYYEGYGFAFYDEENDKYYFYDEKGRPAYYGNGGIPEYYNGNASAPVDEEMPHSLSKAAGSYIVHKEFTLYPTGKTADEVTRPPRVTASSEVVYWNGEKGSFTVLGGEMDEFKGYIIHTYIENTSDSYIYFGWKNIVVNGVSAYPASITVLRPYSSAYRDIVISAELLKENKIKSVEEIDFSVYAVGENLSVPLYPIQWMAVELAGLKK